MTDTRMDDAMAIGAARYADIIATLNRAGLPTVFTQTGGCCGEPAPTAGFGVASP